MEAVAVASQAHRDCAGRVVDVHSRQSVGRHTIDPDGGGGRRREGDNSAFLVEINLSTSPFSEAVRRTLWSGSAAELIPKFVLLLWGEVHTETWTLHRAVCRCTPIFFSQDATVIFDDLENSVSSSQRKRAYWCYPVVYLNRNRKKKARVDKIIIARSPHARSLQGASFSHARICGKTN